MLYYNAYPFALKTGIDNSNLESKLVWESVDEMSRLVMLRMSDCHKARLPRSPGLEKVMRYSVGEEKHLCDLEWSQILVEGIQVEIVYCVSPTHRVIVLENENRQDLAMRHAACKS